MKTRNLFGILLMAFLVMTGLTACDDDNNTSTSQFVENAKIKEEGQILSPGQIVHLEGEGYLDSDNVILNFYWEINEPYFPEGYIKGYYAEILTRASDGIIIQLPYRKPESRVEVMLMRSGGMMKIGEVRLKDGTTPKDFRLYGINNNLHNKGSWTDATQIMRCIYDKNTEYKEISWPMDEHPDFHSAIGLHKGYGLCGLAATEGVQYPFFFDFCNLKWKKLSNYKTIALFNTPSVIGALQTMDGEKYTINVISSDLETEDYATAKTKSSAGKTPPAYPLPDGLKAEQFGEYPGAYYNQAYTLFSANKGNGKWTPVIFNPDKGIYTLNDIDADGLIPFSFFVKAEGEKDNQKRISGYLVALESKQNGSELYLLDDNMKLQKEPFATFANRAVSVSANHEKQGTLTVHFEGHREGNVTYEYSWSTKEWKPVNLMGGHVHDEIVWTN